jgi:hypothetical protein
MRFEAFLADQTNDDHTATVLNSSSFNEAKLYWIYDSMVFNPVVTAKTLLLQPRAKPVTCCL